MLLRIHKKDLWPIEETASGYYEDDLFDVIEFLYDHVSKPIDGTLHSYAECGMHWNTFNQQEGRREFRDKMNTVLGHYQKRFELSDQGDILFTKAPGPSRLSSRQTFLQPTRILRRGLRPRYFVTAGMGQH